MTARLAEFPHRRDRDGLYDSICPRCYATVARSRPEAEMAELENAHVCNSAFFRSADGSAAHVPGSELDWV
jgi:hypothetical protein